MRLERTVSREDIDRKRKALAEIKQSHRELNAAYAESSRIYLSIDFEKAKEAHRLGLVPAGEWEDFLFRYSGLREQHAHFTSESWYLDQRKVEESLENSIAELEREFRKQNSFLRRLKRFFCGK